MRDRTVFIIVAGIVVFALLSSQKSYEETYQFDYTFDSGLEGWTPDFADLPKEYNEEIYELEYSQGPLPPELEGNGTKICGHNRSDDLFMYMVKQVTGLKPSSEYSIEFSVDLASNSPEGMMGIGGSPGESVYVKAGAVNFEPMIVEDDGGWFRLNLDKGNQNSVGEDMFLLGTLANPNIDLNTWTGEEFALMNLNNQGEGFTVISSVDGTLWVLIGTDSGFEGLTTVYYDNISVTFTEQ